MYRLQIWNEGGWKWGVNNYSLETAQVRVLELKAKGIKARVRPLSELFG